MKKLKLALLLSTILLGFACSDKEETPGGKVEQGPAGSVELLYGTWGITSMRLYVNKQWTETPVSGEISTLTFYSDGTAKEYQNGVYAYATWSYNQANRLIRMHDSNYGNTYDWSVNTLTANTFIVDWMLPVEGETFRCLMTYAKSGSNQATAENHAAGVAPAVKLAEQAIHALIRK